MTSSNEDLLNKLGSKHSLLMKSGQFMSYYKRKDFIKKFYKHCNLKISFRPFCVGKIKNNICWKKKLLKQATCITFVLAKLSELVQISTQN